MSKRLALSEQQVRERLEEALREVLDNDGYLLANNLSERCIASRLAMYLQRQFSAYDVDIEYNRGRIAKKTEPARRMCKLP